MGITYIVMKEMSSPGYHHNGIVAAQALAHMMWLHIAGTNELKSDQRTKQGAQRPSCFCEI